MASSLVAGVPIPPRSPSFPSSLERSAARSAGSATLEAAEAMADTSEPSVNLLGGEVWPSARRADTTSIAWSPASIHPPALESSGSGGQVPPSWARQPPSSTLA